MLVYSAIPAGDDFWLVVYPTPGCIYTKTVACVCRTEAQADAEAARLNDAQAPEE